MNKEIKIQHGSGGSLTSKLVQNIFYKHFNNPYLLEAHDSARLPGVHGRLAFTTDSYVINPLQFPGGNIGKLAVCGTVNDLAMSGARPLYISCGFIIEAGFSMELLEEIVRSMAETAKEAGVIVVTGDTKVVEKGNADKLFINTSGIGEIPAGIEICGQNARPGDAVIVSGTLGDHGIAVMLQRQQLQFQSSVKSDCAPLNGLVSDMLKECPGIHVLRDATRGGLATILNEIASQSQVGIELAGSEIPVKEEVQGICEVLGLDPLYLANEGKLLAVVPEDKLQNVMRVMHAHPYGRDAKVIGRIVDKPEGKVFVKSAIGGRRIVDVMTGDPLPRIC
ncbi:Carbamoyl dehydratase HypE [Sporomusa carbonis]|uniref:hydrogenase expression/formation protein HypE n=1 Tax=Sporomusa carbonis TaxID=3076075 RepID=UPI003A6BFB63